MKQFTVAAVNGGMIGHRCAKAAQQDIARLCRGQGHPVKACDRHIVRKGSDRCATSHPHAQNPAYQFPPDGMHPGTACNSPSPRAQSAVLSDVAHSGIYECPPADQPPDSALFICSRRSASLSRADHRDDCGPVPQSPLHLCPQPVFRCNTKIRLRLCRDIHTRQIPLPLRRSHHEAARLRRHTPPGVCQNH